MLLFSFPSHFSVLNLCMFPSLLWLWLSLASGKDLIKKYWSKLFLFQSAGRLFGQYRFVSGWVDGCRVMTHWGYVSILITFRNFQIAFDFVRGTAMDFLLGEKCLTSHVLLAIASWYQQVPRTKYFHSPVFPSSPIWLYLGNLWSSNWKYL